jgi:hypothetical protein
MMIIGFGFRFSGIAQGINPIPDIITELSWMFSAPLQDIVTFYMEFRKALGSGIVFV